MKLCLSDRTESLQYPALPFSTIERLDFLENCPKLRVLQLSRGRLMELALTDVFSLGRLEDASFTTNARELRYATGQLSRLKSLRIMIWDDFETATPETPFPWCRACPRLETVHLEGAVEAPPCRYLANTVHAFSDTELPDQRLYGAVAQRGSSSGLGGSAKPSRTAP